MGILPLGVITVRNVVSMSPVASIQNDCVIYESKKWKFNMIVTFNWKI